MSSPKAPPQQALLPISDANKVTETLVTELTGTSTLGPNLHMVFSVHRPSFHVTGPTTTEMRIDRNVASLLVIPLLSIPDMIGQLQHVLAAQQVQQQLGQIAPKSN